MTVDFLLLYIKALAWLPAGLAAFMLLSIIFIKQRGEDEKR